MSKENLQNREAVEKLKEMVNHIDICMLSTFPKQQEYPHSIPMSQQAIDNEGAIWFLFSTESESYRHLLENKKVSVTFSDPRDYKFLSINGIAEVFNNDVLIDKYWNQYAEAWFEKGKEDPHIRILKVVPQEAHYWDKKNNKLMTMFKIAVSAVTGKQTDVGLQGDLEV